MSLTRTVPAAVPLLRQSSLPWVGSVAVKNSVPFTLVRFAGEELAMPGLMSLTRTVPAVVPLLFQKLSTVVSVVSGEVSGVIHINKDGQGRGGKRTRRSQD